VPTRSSNERLLLRCMCRFLAQSVGGQGVEFTSAFGGAAELHGRTASAAFERLMTLNRHKREDFAAVHSALIVQ
jgi:hypothetical protein